MTSFVNDENEYLQYDGPDPQLSKQAVSIFEFKIKGTFSTNFSIPNNSHNRKVLGYYGPMQINSPAFSLNRFTLARNGTNVERGYIVIQTDKGDSLDCFFISGNGSWFSALNVDMKSLDFDEYNLTWNATNYGAQTAATEGIVFPVVDWGYNGYKLGSNVHLDLQVQNGTDGIVGLESAERISEAYPCFFFHSALTTLANDTGIKIAGDLLTDPTFLGMVMTPSGPDLKWPSVFIEPNRAQVKRSLDQAYTVAAGATVLQFDQVIFNGSSNPYDSTNYRFYCRKTATYKVTLNLHMSVAQAYIVRIRMSGATHVPPGTLTTVFSTTSQSDYYTEFPINANAGDYMEILVTAPSSNYNLLSTSTASFEIYDIIDSMTLIYDQTGGSTIRNRTIITPSAIVPAMKGVDFIKFLASYFNCVVTFDENTQTLSLNKMDSITDQEDWSAYYDSHKSNFNRKLGKNNYIELEAGEEDGIVRYNKGSVIGYGWGNIETDYDTMKESTLYKAPFAPAFDQRNKTKLGWDMPYVEFFRFEDDEPIAFTGVTDTSGEATLGFATNAYTPLPAVVRVVSEFSDYNGYAYPRYLASSASSATLNGVAFTKNTVGFIYIQKVSRISGPHRILFVTPNYDQRKAGGSATVNAYEFQESGSSSSPTVTAMALFCKPKYGKEIDVIKTSLAIKDPIGREFNISIGDLYHSKLKKIFNSPVIEAIMLLPEAVYARYKFDKFVYLETEKLTGLFFVHKIDPYVDAKTLVKVELIFV